MLVLQLELVDHCLLRACHGFITQGHCCILAAPFTVALVQLHLPQQYRPPTQTQKMNHPHQPVVSRFQLSILRRIRRGEFVNLSLLLPHPPHLDPDHKNSRLSVATMEALRYHFPQPQQQQQRRPVHQQITNLESWLRAWSRYLHATVHYFPRKAVQMIAYQDTIISAAERYQFDGLYSYDRAFWAKLAHDPTTRWDTVDDQLWSIWCSTQARPFCSRCHKFGHSVAACPAAARTFRPYQPGQSPRTKDGRIIFLQFNTSSCPNPAKCKFAHVCLKCEGDHAQSSTACGRT